MTIPVKYSCSLCGLVEVTCQVPARQEEDVRTWMEVMLVLVASHHHTLSPACNPKTLSSVMIPMAPGSTKIGGPSEN